jgi:hypothetical protein
MMRWATARLTDIETVPGPGSLRWAPVRRHFDIAAFGVNAYVADELGQDVVERHTEEVRRHEELYVVVSGSATFTLDGEVVAAPAGTLVFVRDFAIERSAVASEPATVVLAIGARPGVPYEPGPWEPVYVARALGEIGDDEGAIAELTDGLELHPGHRLLLYRLAGYEARAGHADDALGHLAEAVAQSDELRARAHADPSFDAIRGDPRFPAVAP